MGVQMAATGRDYTRTATLPSATTVSISMWVRIDTDLNTFSCAFSLDNAAGSPQQMLILECDSDGTTMSFVTTVNLATDVRTLSVVNMTVGVWYWFCVCKSGANVVVYYAATSAAAISSVSASNMVSPTVTTMRVGTDANASWMQGSFAALKIWSGVQLTAIEAAEERWFANAVKRESLWFENSFLRGGAVAEAQTDFSGNGRSLSGGTSSTTVDGPGLSLYSPRRNFAVYAATVNITVSMDVISGVLSLPAPAVNLDQVLSMDLQGITGTAIGPTAVVTDQVLDTGPNTGTFTPIDPTFLFDYTTAVDVISVVSTIIAPAHVFDYAFDVDVVVGTLSAIAPTNVFDFVHPTDLVTGTLSVVDPSISVAIDVAAGVISATGTAIDPTTNFDFVVPIGVVSGTLSIVDPVVSIDATATVAEIALTGSVLAPAFVLDQVLAVDLQSLSGSPLGPTVNFDWVEAVGVVLLSGTALDAEAGGHVVVSADVLGLTGNVVTPGFVLDLAFAVDVVTSSGNAISPTVLTAGDVVVEADLIVCSGAVLTPSVQGDALYVAGVLALTGTLLDPAVTGDAIVSADLVGGTLSVLDPSVSGNMLYAADVITGTLTNEDLVVSGSALIPAGPISLVGSIPLISVVVTGAGNLLLLRRLRMRA